LAALDNSSRGSIISGLQTEFSVHLPVLAPSDERADKYSVHQATLQIRAWLFL
jgi:hypothetical protein